MYGSDPPQPSTHPEPGHQENTENFQRYASLHPNSNALANLLNREQVQSSSTVRSPVSRSKKSKTVPTSVESASMNPPGDPNFRPRNQRVAVAGSVNGRAAVARSMMPTNFQAQGDVSGYQTYPPMEDGYRTEQPAQQQQFDDDYDQPKAPESGGGVFGTLKNLMLRRSSNSTADYEEQRRQHIRISLRAQLTKLQTLKDEEASRLNREIQIHAGEKATLQQRVLVLERNNAKLHEQCNKFDDDLKALQDQSLRHVSTGRWLAQDDRNTGADLKSLRDRIKLWAVEFGIKSLQELDYLKSEERQGDRANLDSQLRSILDGVGEAFAPKDISEKKVTSTMLTAILAHEVHEKVLSNPFFFLDGGVSQPPGSVFLNVYNQWIKVNATEAHQWRCKMIRAMTEQPNGMDGKPTPLFHFPEQKHAACTQLTNNFLSGPARFLLRTLDNPEEAKARDQEVFEIWMEAGRLSTHLGTQLSYTQCHYLRDLRSVKFNCNSPIVEAHMLYKLDDGDHRLNGRDIVMVVFPAVLASGSVDGEGYDQERILAKAVVWMSSEGK